MAEKPGAVARRRQFALTLPSAGAASGLELLLDGNPLLKAVGLDAVEGDAAGALRAALGLGGDAHSAKKARQ